MVRALALLLALAWPGAALAESLAEINARTLAAWSAGDADKATATAEEALATARTEGPADLAAWSTALSNMAYLVAPTDPDRAEALWREVIAQQGDEARTSEAALARLQLGNHLAASGRAGEALTLFTAALEGARGTGWHGQAAKQVADARLAAQDYTGFALAFEEAVAVAPELIRPTYGDTYQRLGQEVTRLESEVRWADTLPLLEAQLTILRTFYDLENRDQAIRNLMYNRYFALTRLGDTARARTQLLAWKSFGTLSEHDRGFIEERLALALPLATGGNIDTLERLETVREALAFASALDNADPRLGLALRTLASAEGHFGQGAAAIRSLETGIAILEKSAEGRRHVHLLYDDLGWNLALAGQDARADIAYARSDAARALALTYDPDDEAPADRAWRRAGRA